MRFSLICTIYLLLTGINPLHAQGSWQSGLLPALNISRKLNDSWALNLKGESRVQLIQGDFSGEWEDAEGYQLTDMSIQLVRKTGLNNNLAVGYLTRFRGDAIIHRTVLQYTQVRRYSSLRLAHRLVADQTYSESEPVSLRLRYRITLELPLEGQAIDAGEWYLKMSNEYLNELQAGQYDLEFRLIPFLGYYLNDRSKWELGIDYRLGRFLREAPGHVFWLSLNSYLRF